MREGFRRLALAVAATGAVIFAAIGLALTGRAEMATFNYVMLILASSIAIFVILWFPIRLLGWVVAGFFDAGPSQQE